MRVVWYAGRKFKPRVSSQPKVNGTTKADEPMVIDLDDDDEPPQPQPPGGKVEFEPEEDEVDPSHPYHDVLRHLDIPLGTSGLRLAVPWLHTDLSESSYSPGIFKDHAVIAVAGTDLSIRLVAFPLEPPAPGFSDTPQTGVQIALLLGPGGHQDLITSIALTYTRQLDDSGDDEAQYQNFSFLVASTSCTGSGLLLVHQLPVKGTRLVPDAEHSIPIRRQHLRLPLVSAKLSFNTSTYPAERHSTLLITIPGASCVKVYQVFRQHPDGRHRRGSATTTDSASSTRSVSRFGVDNGKFLITLLPGFSTPNNLDPSQPRKSVIDAKWITGGRAVLALTQGGEWGVWDLEAAGPVSSSNQKLIKGQGNVSGISGGSWNRFAITGVLPSPASGSHAIKSPPTSSSGLIPATPHTRKAQAHGLFEGGSGASMPSNSLQWGSITTSASNDSVNEESIIINYGTQNFYIPSILSQWKSEATGKGGFTASSSNSAILPPLRLGEENIKSVSLLPHFPKQQDGPFGAKTYPNFMVTTSTRLILFVSPLTETTLEENATEMTRPMQISRATTDRSLLQRGALDVDGMDRILEGMDSSVQSNFFPGSKSASRAKPNFGKSVGFSNDDMDITPDLPSPTTTSRFNLSKNEGTERRLFS